MLSAKCDRLRRLADHLDEHERGMGEYVSAMRDAADTIWQLRNTNLDTANENDNLKVENAKLRAMCARLADLADRGLMGLSNEEFSEVINGLRDLRVDVFD